VKQFGLGLAVALVTATSAYSASVVDVDNLFIGDANMGWAGLAGRQSFDGQHGSVTAMQTWTVGRTGRLQRLDLFGETNGFRETQDGAFADSHVDADYFERFDFNVTLTILSGGSVDLPGSIELGSVTRRASEVAFHGVSSFDLGALEIDAVAGQVLTFAMSVDPCADLPFCTNGWVNIFRFQSGGDTSGYAGGSSSLLGSRSGLTLFPEYDMNFRTWVSAVPEPATWALMILGFGLVGGAIRVSRNQVEPSRS